MAEGPVMLPTDPRAKRGFLEAELRRAFADEPFYAPHAELAFETLEPLGEGGMGAVFRIRDRRLGREAALKLLKDPLCPPEIVDRFLEEARILGQLTHPAIPPLYEAGCASSGRVYMLMRVVEGRTFKEEIARYHEGGRPEAKLRGLLEVLIKAAEAVAYAHSRGLIHRDLKPANVMVGAYGEVMVIDWGIAKDLGKSEDSARFAGWDSKPAGLTQAGTVLGTPGYMPPEQASGAAVDERSDVYALGAILCQVLTGETPVLGSDGLARLANTIKGKIRRPRAIDPALPPELDALAAAALAFEREDRLAKAEAFAAELRAYLAGAELSVYSYSGLERSRRWLRDRPGLLLFIAFLGLASAGLGVIWAQSERLENQRLLAKRKLERSQEAVTEAEKKAEKAEDEAENERRLARAFDEARDLIRRRAAPDEIRAALDKALKAKDRSYASLREAASILIGANQREAARALLREASERFPPGYEALFRLYSLELGGESGSSDTLSEIARRARRAKDKNEYTLFAEAVEAWLRRDTPEAMRCLNAAEQRNPRLAEVTVLRGLIGASRGDFEEALRHFDRAIEIDPFNYKAYRARSAVLQKHEGNLAALPDLTKALSLESEFAPLWYYRGQIHFRLGDRRTAIKDYTRAVELEPENPELWAARAAAFLAVEKNKRAFADFERAIALSPRQASYWNSRGSVLERLERPQAALESYGRSIAIDPAYSEAWANRAALHMDLGNWEEALKGFKEALRLRPDDALSLCNRGSLYLKRGAVEAALKDYDRAVQIAPKDSEAFFGRARCRRRLGRPEAAIIDFTSAIALRFGEPKYYAYRAEALETQGRIDEALADYRRCLRLAPPENIPALTAKVRELEQRLKGR